MKIFPSVNTNAGKPRNIKHSLREFEAMLANEESVTAISNLTPDTSHLTHF